MIVDKFSRKKQHFIQQKPHQITKITKKQPFETISLLKKILIKFNFLMEKDSVLCYNIIDIVRRRAVPLSPF